MMAAFSKLGNDLHTGARSFDFVGKWRVWFAISGLLVVISLLVPMLRGGFNLGIEFRGGSEFRVSQTANTDEALASDVVAGVLGQGSEARVAVIGTDAVRVQTFQVSEDQSGQISQGLAEAYGVDQSNVAVSFINPSWGADVSAQALRGLIIFLLLAAVLMALYFRTWKMALAAIVALLHDLIITAGFYGVTGVEITPAAMIGFLTILGYSLYDTVVVFDKVRENTAHYHDQHERTFVQLINWAVNQTLVRSINTSVVALLPVASILFIGALLLGAGTLRDISLALFVGILVGTYSTIFVASPLYALLRGRERAIREHAEAVADSPAEVRESEVTRS